VVIDSDRLRTTCIQGKNAGAPSPSQQRPHTASAPSARAWCELFGEPGLADTVLARNHQQAASSGKSLGEQHPDLVELTRATDEGACRKGRVRHLIGRKQRPEARTAGEALERRECIARRRPRTIGMPYAKQAERHADVSVPVVVPVEQR
jgi:hypothetical protein